MHKPLTIFLLISTLALSGCMYIRFPGVYKIDIGQGNILKEEDIAKLKPGMTKRQVRYVLGEALIQDPFHPDRWDYFYSLKPGKKPITQKHFLVYFEDGKLIDSLGDCCTAEELEKDLNIVPGARPKEGAEVMPDENEYSSIVLPMEKTEASREENGYSDLDKPEENKTEGEESGEGKAEGAEAEKEIENTRDENGYSGIKE